MKEKPKTNNSYFRAIFGNEFFTYCLCVASVFVIYKIFLLLLMLLLPSVFYDWIAKQVTSQRSIKYPGKYVLLVFSWLLNGNWNGMQNNMKLTVQRMTHASRELLQDTHGNSRTGCRWNPAVIDTLFKPWNQRWEIKTAIRTTLTKLLKLYTVTRSQSKLMNL